MFLWLWCRTAATTPIGPQAWEHLYAEGAALKRPKKKKKEKKTGGTLKNANHIVYEYIHSITYIHVLFYMYDMYIYLNIFSIIRENID